MVFALTALLGCVLSVGAHELSQGPRCAMEDIPESDQIQVEVLTLNFVRNVCSKSATPEKIPMCGVKNTEPILSTIPLAFHILHYEDGRNNITMDRIQETVRIVNEDYTGRPGAPNTGSNTNFRFEIHSVNRWANDLWASTALATGGGLTDTRVWPLLCRDFPNWAECTDFQGGYKPEIAIDRANVMNLYIGEMRGGVLGMCPFPFFGQPDAGIHGCVIHPGAIVGDKDFDFVGYNEGGTATHEIGHGLGLWHVWQGGCNRNIVDVAVNPQETNSRGCPDPIPDSCGDGLPDNIHNFMDYSDDDCRWEFTITQSDRVDMIVAAWHPGYLDAEIQEAIKEADPNAWAETLAFQSRYETEKLPAFLKATMAMDLEME